MWAPQYDSHNDQFAAALSCPWPGCGCVDAAEPVSDSEVWVCAACLRPYEVVRLVAGEGLAGERAVIARRPQSLWCAKTGQPLTASSGVDHDQAGGNASRTGTHDDAAGRIFGAPSRMVEWDLQPSWTQSMWGHDEDPRDSELVTSVSVHRGIVIAATASGRFGLFSPHDGAPRLARSLVIAGAPFDATARENALRLPIALRRGHLCAATERFAVFRDLTPSLFPHAPLSTDVGAQAVVDADPGLQWIGPPLVTGGSTPQDPVVVVLATGSPRGANAPPDHASLRFFTQAGNPCGRVDVPDLARPPIAIAPGRIATVNALGHVSIVSVATQSVEQLALPERMLDLGPTERWHFLYCAGPGGGEIWLADERDGAVRVWRAPLARIQSGTFAWEERFESKGLGALLSLSVGPVAAGRTHPASEHFVLTTERSVAAYSRVVRHPAAEAVLAQAPRGPSILTSVGIFAQDEEGLWLRGLGAWSFRDDNLERRVRPNIARPPPSFFDRTFCVYGRQVFYSTGSAISGARVVAREEAPTVDDE